MNTPEIEEKKPTRGRQKKVEETPNNNGEVPTEHKENDDLTKIGGFDKPISITTENENDEREVLTVNEPDDTFGVPNENEVTPEASATDQKIDAPTKDVKDPLTGDEEVEIPEIVIEAHLLGTQLDKFKGFKAELAIAETLDEIKFITNKAAATAEFARRNKIGLDEQNEWGKFRIEIEAKKGDWLNKNYPAGGDRKSRLNQSNLKKEGIKPNESANARLVSDNPDLAKKVMNEIEKVGKFIITPNAVSAGIKKIIKKAANTEIKKTEETEPVLDEQQPKKRGRISKANRIIDSEE